MRWVFGTLVSLQHFARVRPPVLFGDGHPRTAQEEIKAIAGLWRVQVRFENRYNADLSLYLEPSGGVVVTDVDKLPYNLDQRSLAWSYWSADRIVIAGADGDNELCFSLQLGHLKFEGRGERFDFRCSEFVGEVLYEGVDSDPIGTFAMQLSLPMKSDVAPLEERYWQRIAERPPPSPAFPFTDFIGRWFMGLSEFDIPGTVFFPVELSADGSWQSFRTMPVLTGTWGVCSGDLRSFGGGPNEQPIGSKIWLTLGSDVCLQGTPELKPEEREFAAHTRADGSTVVSSDEVDGNMWQGDEESAREYFGEFRLLRESALAASVQGHQAKRDARAKKAEREAAAWNVEERPAAPSPTPEELPDLAAGMMMAEEWAATGMVAEEDQFHSGMAEEDQFHSGMVTPTGNPYHAEAAMPEAPMEHMDVAGRLSEDEAKHAWLAARGLNVPLWGPQQHHNY